MGKNSRTILKSQYLLKYSTTGLKMVQQVGAKVTT